MKSEYQLTCEFAKLDIQGKQLPYEKQELELVMPRKIKKRLKNFKPLECIQNLKF